MAPLLLRSRVCISQKQYRELEQIQEHVFHWPSHPTHGANVSAICGVLGLLIPTEHTLLNAQEGTGISWIHGAGMTPLQTNSSHWQQHAALLAEQDLSHLTLAELAPGCIFCVLGEIG